MTRQRTLRIKPRILSASVLFLAALTVLTVFAATATAQNPVPFIDQPLVPDATAPGGAGFTLTVNGAGFVAASVVNWNGSPRATTFISSSQLTAAILATDIATASTAAVTVVSPSPGGGSSSPLFFPIHTPTAVAAFSTTDYGQVAYPISAATGDFNGDGRVDLVVADNGGGALSVLLGNGDGTFQSPVGYAIDGYPVQAIVGDFNGDGKLDLAAPYNLLGKGGLAILLGYGNGAFRPAVSYPTACEQGPGGMTADFNGDGNLDLLTVQDECVDPRTISILLGNGDGTFRAPANYEVGLYPVEEAAGDFNRDGILDIAVANSGSNTVSVLLGNGDGTFQPAVNYATGSAPGGVNIADINGDGKLDLIVPNFKSDSVSVLLGNGDGTFASHVDYPVAGGPLSSRIGDFNEDGKLDIVVTTTGPALDLLLGNGDGTFQPALSIPTSAVPLYPVDVVVADFNGDGRLDAAAIGDALWVIAVMLQAAPVPANPTTTTLVSSLNPSVFGQGVTLTAQVTSASGTPTGAVLFNATPYYGFVPGLLANGQTSTSAPGGFNAGTTSITAAYQGITGFNPSTSSVLYQVVNKATTTTSLTSSSNPALIKQSVTFTATVNPQFIGFNPTGAVTFYSGQQSLGTATLSYGRATLTTSFAAGGTYSITAQYNGDSNFYGSTSSMLSQAILASTTTTLVSSLNPSTYGQAVTFTATVSSSAGAPPNGEIVTFHNGSAVLGTAPLSGGTAPLTTSSLPVGTFTITASYSGDANFRASTSPGLRQVVNSTSKSTTSTAISSSLNPSIYGQAVTFTATVTSTDGTPPNGEIVTFYNGSAVLGTAPLSGGIASLTTSSLPAGIFTITASYAGDANFSASTSAGLRQVVNSTTKSATATTLASTPNPSIYGQAVTWTATVTTSGSVPPTGTVKFTWGYNIGTATLNSSGVATLTKSNLNADTYPLTAVYAGDASNLGSTSPVLNQVITQATSSATLSSSPNPSTQDQAVTFTAAITSPTVKPTGPVTFTAGKTVLGTAQLSGGRAKFTTSTLAVGSTKVTATYYGDSNIAKSSASVSQTVQQ